MRHHTAPTSQPGNAGYTKVACNTARNLQVILNKKGDTYDGKQSDVWSSGVMLYVTLVGQYPFERPEDKGDPQKMHRMIRRIVNVDYKLPSRVEVSDQCKVRGALLSWCRVGWSLPPCVCSMAPLSAHETARSFCTTARDTAHVCKAAEHHTVL